MPGKVSLKSYFLFLMTFLIFGTVGVFAQANGTDTQIWTQNSFEFPLDRDNEKLSGIILSDVRLTEDISDLSDLRLGFGVKYKVNNNINIQPSYMYRAIRVNGREGRGEHHLLFDVNANKNFSKVSLDNRSRFEHRIKDSGGNDDTFYRNRVRLRVPVRKGDKTVITPFVSTDVWFDLQDAEVERNDLATGINRRINKNTSVDLYYLYRRNFQVGNKHENVIGINFNFKID